MHDGRHGSLRRGAEHFKPDEFLATSSLVPLEVFHRGQPATIRSRGELEASGFILAISNLSWSDLPGQVDEVMTFLKRNRAELLRLAEDETAEDIRLRFPTNLRLEPDEVFAQFDYLPAKLIAEAGGLRMGIELALYPPTWDGGGDAG
jgi:hypothetical protein